MINSLLDSIRLFVQSIMHKIAAAFNRLTGGNLSPHVITLVSFAAHVPIAWLIATGRHNYLAAGLLVIFAMFDALDGSLARIQKSESNTGMLLDATTDRMKEVILYTGVAISLTFPHQQIIDRTSEGPIYSTEGPDIGEQYLLATAVAALGGSLLVSYVKAKGETAIAGKGLPANEVNRLFQNGLARFEVRMFLLVLGLLSNELFLAVLFVAVLSWLTVFDRLIKISRKLS